MYFFFIIIFSSFVSIFFSFSFALWQTDFPLCYLFSYYFTFNELHFDCFRLQWIYGSFRMHKLFRACNTSSTNEWDNVWLSVSNNFLYLFCSVQLIDFIHFVFQFFFSVKSEGTLEDLKNSLGFMAKTLKKCQFYDIIFCNFSSSFDFVSEMAQHASSYSNKKKRIYLLSVHISLMPRII